MTIQLVHEQYITDAAGHKTHVILPVEFYERLKSFLDDRDFNITETYQAQDRAAAADWDSPEMAVYDAKYV